MPHSSIAFAGAPLDLAENHRTTAELTAFSKAKNARAVIMHHGKFLTKKTHSHFCRLCLWSANISMTLAHYF